MFPLLLPLFFFLLHLRFLLLPRFSLSSTSSVIIIIIIMIRPSLKAYKTLGVLLSCLSCPLLLRRLEREKVNRRNGSNQFHPPLQGHSPQIERESKQRREENPASDPPLPSSPDTCVQCCDDQVTPRPFRKRRAPGRSVPERSEASAGLRKGRTGGHSEEEYTWTLKNSPHSSLTGRSFVFPSVLACYKRDKPVTSVPTEPFEVLDRYIYIIFSSFFGDGALNNATGPAPMLRFIFFYIIFFLSLACSSSYPPSAYERR